MVKIKTFKVFLHEILKKPVQANRFNIFNINKLGAY